LKQEEKNLCPILRSNKNALLSFAFIGQNCLLSNNLSNLLNVSKATNVILENHYHISHKITKYLLDKYCFFKYSINTRVNKNIIT